MFFFFFSSRRRHTRFSRDWSSDVCSSDLLAGVERFVNREKRPNVQLAAETFVIADACSLVRDAVVLNDPTSRTRAQIAVDAHVADHPEARGTLRVVSASAA